MKLTIKSSMVAAGLLMMSGCSFMSPVKIGPDTGYVINTVPDHVAKARERGMTLMVMHPETNPAYNTTRIAFTMHPYQLSYYSQSRWIETPSDMLGPLIAQTLLNSGHYKSVISPPFIGQYHYTLRTQIKTLDVDYARSRPALRLTVLAQIVNSGNGHVIATREFKVAEALHQYSPYGAVVAANRATSIFLTELSAWTVRHTR